MATSNKKIVNSGSESWKNHRGDFETCPSCSHKEEWKTWRKLAITLILNPKFYRAGSVVVVSECPKCFKKSWTHENTSGFEYYDEWPETWRSKVKTLDAKLKLEALREWGSGLCHGCKHLKEGRVEYTTFRTCKVGMGPVETKCKSFEKFTKLNIIG